MDVTPGPQLRRRITVADEKLDHFNTAHMEWLNDDNLPQPDWMSWSMDFATELRGILKLVRQ